MISNQKTANDILKEMWDYQSLDLGRHYLSDIAWDTNRDSAIAVKHADGNWHLCVDDTSYGAAFPDRLSATQAGHILIDTEIKVHARAMERHKVPMEVWERGSTVTQLRHKQNRDLTMYHLGGTWFVILGQYPFGEYASAEEATTALRRNPPVDARVIKLLEAVYSRSAGYPCHRRDADDFAEMERHGLITLEVTADEESVPLAFLTDKGREAMDADPRGLLLPLRDIILKHARDDMQRSEWNRYFGVGSYETNGRNLQEALASGLEFYMDVVESDPNELCIKANGTYKNGHSARDLTIMLFCPHWTDTDLVDSATALIDTIIEHREALVTEAQRLDHN